MSEMTQLLERIAVLEKQAKENGTGDPIENRNRALEEHLAQKSATLPLHDVDDLIKRANAIRQTPDNADLTGAFVYAVGRFMAKNGPVAHEFAYIQDLAEEAHQHALDSKTASTAAKDSSPEGDGGGSED